MAALEQSICRIGYSMLELQCSISDPGDSIT
jgi:hypothetical protein